MAVQHRPSSSSPGVGFTLRFLILPKTRSKSPGQAGTLFLPTHESMPEVSGNGNGLLNDLPTLQHPFNFTVHDSVDKGLAQQPVSRIVCARA